MAARYGNVSMLEHLEGKLGYFAEGDTMYEDKTGCNKGFTAFMESAYHGHLPAVKHFLNHQDKQKRDLAFTKDRFGHEPAFRLRLLLHRYPEAAGAYKPDLCLASGTDEAEQQAAEPASSLAQVHQAVVQAREQLDLPSWVDRGNYGWVEPPQLKGNYILSRSSHATAILLVMCH